MNYKPRINEVNFNHFGSHMEIIEYRNARDIDVYFKQYDWVSQHKEYRDFKQGMIKCPYEPSVYGVGYLGEGIYKVKDNNKTTVEYEEWRGMIRRCYDAYLINKYPTYIDCTVADTFLCFQNYARWREDNYYQVPNDKMCLDKDILYKGNKIYAPTKCTFVPNRINVLFTKADKRRGDLPIGVCYDKGYYLSHCSVIKNDKKTKVYLGRYSNPQEAFYSYKTFKENYIKQVADEYKTLIPSQLYEALYRWEVDIDD